MLQLQAKHRMMLCEIATILNDLLKKV